MKFNVLMASVALTFGGLVLLAPDLAAQSEASRTVSRLTDRDGREAVIVEDLSMPNRDVTSLAGRYAEGTDIAVTGTVAEKDGAGFILNRRDGQVRALIGDPGDDRMAVGDVVTVYGRLKRVPLDLVQVETEVVHDKKSGSTYLTMLGHQRTAQSTAAGNTVKLRYRPL